MELSHAKGAGFGSGSLAASGSKGANPNMLRNVRLFISVTSARCHPGNSGQRRRVACSHRLRP